jgi:hypothetical protein
MKKEENNKPSKEFRLGLVRAAIWERAGQHGTLYHVTVSRLYRDGDNKWASSQSFGRDELPILAKVVEEAHLWCYRGAPEGGEESQGSAGFRT